MASVSLCILCLPVTKFSLVCKRSVIVGIYKLISLLSNSISSYYSPYEEDKLFCWLFAHYYLISSFSYTSWISLQLSLSLQQHPFNLFFLKSSITVDSNCNLRPCYKLNSRAFWTFTKVPNFDFLSLRKRVPCLYYKEQWFLLTLISLIMTWQLLFLPKSTSLCYYNFIIYLWYFFLPSSSTS